jgi:hypothetical protein
MAFFCVYFKELNCYDFFTFRNTYGFPISV